MRTPDITLAQILAAVTFIAGQLVAMGAIDNDQSQLLLQVGTTVVTAVWVVADSIIRHGRATGGVTGTGNVV